MTAEPLRPIVIEAVDPELDGGRYPVKRGVGDTVEVSADIFKEGHDLLAAVVLYRPAGQEGWHETPMESLGNDRWQGRFVVSANTRYRYTVEAVVDPFASWRAEVVKKHAAGQDLAAELLEGVELVRQAAERAAGADGEALRGYARRLAEARPHEDALVIASEETLVLLMTRHLDRSAATLYRELEVVVDRVAARCAAWYEMFARSQGTVPGRSATFRDCERRLGEISQMGFDVIYLPPVHPIGRTGRKGKNNALEAGPGDPGSPWAIGNEHGGHETVDPALGTLDDFDRFVGAVRAAGMEVALDFALQCSPDHPWVREHPEWFFRRPDGTLRYAENPPKKYQDVYPLDLGGPHREALWRECRQILLHWIRHGVRIFRVDNPHTKPIPFWAWLIREIQERHPDVIFLSEAFTRPAVMKSLAKAGFSQSYTYFTWRNTKAELTDYLTELVRSPLREYFRGNLFPSTPDILPEILQQGGRPAFKVRFVLAATLSSVYGLYNGFELCEGRALPGTEEYLDSEKYEIKVRDWNRPGHIKDYVARVNWIRREHRALQGYDNLRFYQADDDQVLFYGKMTPEKDDVILVAVNLDPFATHETIVHIPLAEIGLRPGDTYQLHELITDTRRLGQGPTAAIRLDPAVEPAAVFAVRRWARREHDFDYFC